MSEDGENVQQPRNKTMVFTLEERKLLLKLVNMYFEVLNNKRVDSASTQLKNNAWEAIHKKYLENTGLIKLPRTPQQLKRCWENMKCKAKKGDPMSVKLLRWGEAQYKLQRYRNEDSKDRINGSVHTDSLDEDSDLEFKDDIHIHEIKLEMEEIQNVSSQKEDESIMKLKEDIENSECGHCTCDKSEKAAAVQLLATKRKHFEELHQLKMQLIKEKIQCAKELHKLSVHEMSLKVENERRRAEILERELTHSGTNYNPNFRSFKSEGQKPNFKGEQNSLYTKTRALV